MAENTCRICLEKSNALFSLNSKQGFTTPSEKLIKLKIKLNALGPTSICKQCLDELENCIKFYKKCKYSNRVVVARYRGRESLNLQGNIFEQDTGGLEIRNDQTTAESETNENETVKLNPTVLQSPKKSCSECGSRRRCVHSPPLIYTCQQCRKQFTRKFNYSIHLKRHLGQREWPCITCKAPQVSSCLSRTHCAPKARRECPIPGCERSYTSAHNLTKHIHSHTGEKPHACAHCGKRFTSKGTLNDHVRTHTGVKPYMCSICGATFATNKLAAHVRTHHRPRRAPRPRTPARPQLKGGIACAFCAAKYTHKQSLNRHIRRQHSGIQDLPSVKDGFEGLV